VSDVHDELRQLLSRRTGRVIVGVTGPPGAGKSTLALELVEAFRGTAAYVPMDGFHLSNTQLDRLGRRDRKGAPDTFDVDGYVTTLRRVSASFQARDVYVPAFDRAIDEPVAAGLVVQRDVRFVVTEGNYLACSEGGWAGARGLFDRVYYVDCPSDVRRRRLIERHVAGGRSHDEAVAWVDAVDEPNAVVVAAAESNCDQTLYVDDEVRP
jgi:pantothenate kinase